ncbi:Hypothetical predicted protein [Cloeon dipterum]|uniref:BTB domain-containing protein n=1 Tax=Cloeon dipterum TaxID=197152 RepID=A0A8S1D5D4_9INSE|nr:Hypothetical predicted protein [Cloeon dipterum]
MARNDLKQFTVLVGQGGEMQEYPVSKFDLYSSSTFFVSMIPETSDEPLKIPDADPKLFRHILAFMQNPKEFKMPSFNKVEELTSLALMAEKYMVTDLCSFIGKNLSDTIEKTDVWRVYNEGREIETLATACEQMLCSDTDFYLDNLYKNKVEPETLAKFLSLSNLNVNSEEVLIKACLKNLVGADKRETFRKYFLPKLRLLTLMAADLKELYEFLLPEEALFLLSQLRDKTPLLTPSDLPKDHALCLEKSKRKFEKSYNLKIVNDEDILDLKGVVLEGKFNVLNPGEYKFVLSFTALQSIVIKGVFLFAPLDLCRDDLVANDFVRYLQCKENHHCCIDACNLELKVKVEPKGNPDDSRDITLDANNRLHRMNKWFQFTKPFMVPMNARISLHVVLRGGALFMRHLKTEQASILKCNDDSIARDVFDKINLEYFQKEDGSDSFNRVFDGEFTIFKSISYKLNH